MANKLIFICVFDHSMFFSCFYPVKIVIYYFFGLEKDNSNINELSFLELFIYNCYCYCITTRNH